MRTPQTSGWGANTMLTPFNRVYIQTHAGSHLLTDGRLVYQHCVMEQLPHQPISTEDLLARTTWGPADLFVGSVPTTLHLLDCMGLARPEPNYYPEALRDHLHRDIRPCTRGEVAPDGTLEAPGGLSAWMRTPAGRRFYKSQAWKGYTGRMITRESDLQEFLELPADEPLWSAAPVIWIAEFRVYVIQGRILAISRYDEGEAERELDRAIVQAGIDRLTALPETPAAYAIDWGVLDNGKTALVEMNDGWAIGAYSGLSSRDYFELLTVRWKELTAS